VTGGWGEPDQEGTPENGEGISSTRNIAEGVTLEINGDVVTAVMRSPELREHLWRIADQLAAEANQLAVHVGEANRPDPFAWTKTAKRSSRLPARICLTHFRRGALGGFGDSQST
jgi:hypothetical protein